MVSPYNRLCAAIKRIFINENKEHVIWKSHSSYMVKFKKKPQKWWLYDHFCENENNSFLSRCNSHTYLLYVYVCANIYKFIFCPSHIVITKMQLKWPTLDIFTFLFDLSEVLIFFPNLYYFISYTLMFWMFRAYLFR